jgi:uncharacterized protein YjbI with pentapeptide repeats
MADSGTKLSMTKCKLSVLFQCISSSAGIVIASHCDFICSGIAMRGSSSCSSFDVTDSTFNLMTESSLGISSSHGQKSNLSGCKFVNGMCGIMIDSDAICNVTKSTFSGCKFSCRCRDSLLQLSRCEMYDCQKCLHSFGPKGNIQAKDCRFEKIALNCVECASESRIALERCVVENSATCVVKTTSNSSLLIMNCSFVNCNTKVVVATGSSNIKMVGCSFTSMSGNGFDFSDNVTVFMENIVFHVCSGIGIQLSASKLHMVSSKLSSILSHCVLCKKNSFLHATDCIFEFCNGKRVGIEQDSEIVIEADPSSCDQNIVLVNCEIY